MGSNNHPQLAKETEIFQRKNKEHTTPGPFHIKYVPFLFFSSALVFFKKLFLPDVSLYSVTPIPLWNKQEQIIVTSANTYCSDKSRAQPID